MYYTVREGVHRSWRDRASDVLHNIRHRTWLPIAVATIVTAWLGLIIAGLNQTVPPVVGPPSHISNTAGSIPVGYKTTTPTDLSVTSTTTSSSNSQAKASVTPVSTSSTTVSATNVSADTADVIGGRGGDTSSATPSASATVDPSTESNDSAIGVDVGVGDVVDASVGVGGGSLLQADVNVGGLSLSL